MNELGGNVTKHITLTDAAGALTDADSTPTATITLPDSTTVTPSVTRTSLGYYTIDYATTLGADHLLKWTGDVGGAPFVFTDSFYVWDPTDFVVSLTDAKQHLNITSSTTDDELRMFILRAQATVETRIGPVTEKTVTRRVGRYGQCSTSLLLPVMPVVELTSITPLRGTALTVSDFTVTTGGVVTGIGVEYPFKNQPYDVVYVAGRATITPDLYLAVLETIRHLWETQRGNSRTVWTNPEDLDAAAPLNVYGLLPPRVEQLLAPYMQVGFA